MKFKTEIGIKILLNILREKIDKKKKKRRYASFFIKVAIPTIRK